jgi:putative intracellular protease/amidase
MILRDNSADMTLTIEHEVKPMIAGLRAAGYKVEVADESGAPVGNTETRVAVDLKLADARARNYAGVIVPCMASAEFPNSAPPETVRVMKEAVKAKMPIAAEHAAELLMPTGVAATKRIASSPSVVRDGFLVTSYNCPNQASVNGRDTDVSALVARFVDAMQGR